jgi:alcohol dehydrogenase
MENFDFAQALLDRFKGEKYIHGIGVLPRVGRTVALFGKRAVLVRDVFPGSDEWVTAICSSLETAGVTILEKLYGAAPNAPREDVHRIATKLAVLQPDVIIAFGGGSTIDCVKAAEVLHSLGGDVEDYFGTGLVTKALAGSGKKLPQFVAIQTAASSSAHLTKYSNITDLSTGQKKLIVDEAIVPPQPIFDYGTTVNSPAPLTVDGAMDGVSHIVEVLYNAVGKPYYDLMEQIANVGIGLVVEYLPEVIRDPRNPKGREALGLATDLGGYAIMIGGTNGAHLTSFSLVDILSHGRACAMLNPYYAVFFAPVVEKPLRLVGSILQRHGFMQDSVENLSGRRLGLAVAEAMLSFEAKIGMPSCLGEVPGFTDAHIERALAAAKNPQLKMKLENMPVPLTADMVDDYMGPVLQAAKTGNLELIKNVE